MKPVKVHCMTNPVTMQDVANILLTVGASPIMAQDPKEAAEITRHTDALLLNTGVPSDEKWTAWENAGRAAAECGHPIVLDPVGAGASGYRRSGLSRLLRAVRPQLIRCNQAEACALLEIRKRGDLAWNGGPGTEHTSGSFRADRGTEAMDGVDSELDLSREQSRMLASELAQIFGCAVLVSGTEDIVSDGTEVLFIGGGDARVRRITGGGCMLSALCAWRLGAGDEPFAAATSAGRLWRTAAETAGKKRTAVAEGAGPFMSACSMP